MSREIENALAALDGFRMCDQMDYAAYSQLHDLISELDVAEPIAVHCEVCEELESGDTLYSHTSDDIGDMYSAIRDIQFCPKCGKRLRTFQEKKGR